MSMFKMLGSSLSSVKKSYLSTCAAAYFPKVYTRTGDTGQSSTFTGERRNKDDVVFEALGTTDELTSAIGYAREVLPESCENINFQLQEVQCIIQDLASAIATPKSSSKSCHEEISKFPAEHVEILERWIDEHTKDLPPLRNFILPSGGPSGAAMHLARAICRRAERRVVTLIRTNEVDKSVLCYLNRLSDYLFIVARVSALASGHQELMYRKGKVETTKANLK